MGRYKRKKMGMLLSFTLLLTACAGGSGEQDETTDYFVEQYGDTGSTALTEDVSETTAEDIYLSAETVAERYPDKTVLTWIYNDMVNITPQVNLMINDILVQNGCDYVLFFYTIPETMFENKINKMISNGSAPDLICASVGEVGTYTGTYRAYQNEWLLDLEEYFQTEDGKRLWEAVPEACWQASMVNDQYLGVCTMFPVCTDAAYYVNQELMERYNLTEEDFQERTVTELGELLALVEEEACCILDMDGSIGSIDGLQTVVENRGYQSDAVVISNKDPNAQVENIFENEDAIAWFHAIADYRQKGYLTDADGDGHFQNFFISLGADNRFDTSYAELMKAELYATYPEAGEIVVIPYETKSLTTYFNSISGVCSSSSHQQEALDALTMIMTNREISDLLLYGIEHTDYELDQNGKAVTDSFAWVYAMYFGNTLISTPTVNKPENKEEVFFEVFASMKNTAVLGRYVDLTEYAEQVQQIQAVTESYAGLWNGEFDDVDGVLEEVRGKLEEIGIQEVVDAANAQLR